MCAFKLLFIWFSISYKTINILKQITLRFTNSKHFVLRIIQVSYNPKKSTETWERESTALIKLSKVLDCKRLIILTYELEDEIIVKDKKIEVIPVWKWLLDF